MFGDILEWIHDSSRSPSVDWISILILGATFDYAFKTILDLLQYKVQCKPEPPAEAKKWNLIDEASFKKSQEYSKAKILHGLAESTFGILVSYWVISHKLVPRIWYFWAARTSSLSWAGERILGVLTSLSLFSVVCILGLPFDWYGKFVVEEKFGFNKSTFGLWVKDLLKMALLSLIFVPIVLILLQTIIGYFGRSFVPYLMIFILVLSLVGHIFYIFLAPLFNKFDPLEDGELRRAIEALASSVNFPLNRIYVVDGSQRSSHSNAYFTGFPWYKQIVLYDTLVKSHSIDEIVAVLAHELGHWKNNHIVIQLGLGMFISVCTFPILLLFLDNEYFFEAIGFSSGDTPIIGALLMYSYAFTPLSTVLTFLQNFVIRTCEYDADRYATRLGKGDHLSTALVTMGKTNLSSVDVHSLYSTYTHSHPIVTERLGAIKAEQTKTR